MRWDLNSCVYNTPIFKIGTIDHSVTHPTKIYNFQHSQVARHRFLAPTSEVRILLLEHMLNALHILFMKRLVMWQNKVLLVTTDGSSYYTINNSDNIITHDSWHVNSAYKFVALNRYLYPHPLESLMDIYNNALCTPWEFLE